MYGSICSIAASRQDDRRLLLLIPFATLISWYGIGFALDAYQLGEGSGDPGGLPQRWIIKSIIPLSFILVIISSIGFMVRAWRRAESPEEGGMAPE